MEHVGSMIARSDTLHNLGITMESKCMLKCYIYTKPAIIIGWMIHIRPFLSEHDTKVLIYALVTSNLDYCDTTFK